jgi:oligopeptide transport system substrate-binding protein
MKKVLVFALCLALLCSMTVFGLAEEPAVFRRVYASEVKTLNYLIAGAQWEQEVGANVIDSLVEYDPYGKLIPGLALTWEPSEDNLTWTFHLRQGVKWYDYQGKEVAEVTANDFVAAAKYVMTPANASDTFGQMEVIKNATEYFAGTVTDFAEVGVKALDDYTLQYTLVKPVPYFLSMLTYVCYLPAYGPQLDELGADFGTSNDKMYYCGAFILSEFEPQVKHTYVKNVNNWDAANVFIDRFERTYNAESATLAPTMVLRDEVDYALLSNDIIDDWKTNNPQYITLGRAVPDYCYFYCFNFDPKYDAAYGPDNWLKAVNNANFRHSIMSAFDRLYSMVSVAGDNAATVIQDTITPKTFTYADGVDFTSSAAFDVTKDDFFNTDKALEYKAKAVEELTAAGATFPIKMVLTYRSDDKDWENEYVLLKQQLEGVLGTDYIECILNAGPTESFLASTRKAGVYSFMRCNWGADYQDPETWTDPFVIKKDDAGVIIGNGYNKMDLMLNSDYADTKAVLEAYYTAVADAKTEVTDMKARFEKFATAEAMLIDNALVVPFFILPAEYQATKLNIYEGQFASFGMSSLKYKGQKLYDHFITPEEDAANRQAWLDVISK